MPDEKKMSFGRHLEELRKRLLVSLAALVVPFVVFFVFFKYHLLRILQAPLMARSGEAISPTTLGPQEIFFVLTKVSLAAAIVVGSPILIYQLWGFIAPGLKETERRAVRPFLVGCMGFFAAGVAVCYFLVLPYVYEFFLQMNSNAGIEVMWSIRNVTNCGLMMLLAFGLGFELPMVIVFLTRVGIVTPQMLSNRRAHSLLVLAATAALITPPDVFTMLALAGPLYLLYELSIVLSRIVHKRKLKRMEG